MHKLQFKKRIEQMRKSKVSEREIQKYIDSEKAADKAQVHVFMWV